MMILGGCPKSSNREHDLLIGDDEISCLACGMIFDEYYEAALMALVGFVQKMREGRIIVDKYDPETWRHPPEPDCVEEWNRYSSESP